MVAGIIAALGGTSGRRTAVTAVAVNSLVVNLPMKMLGRRARPDRTAARVSLARHRDVQVWCLDCDEGSGEAVTWAEAREALEVHSVERHQPS